MAFNSTNLVYSTYWIPSFHGTSRMWDYNAGSDNISTVDGANYFADAAKILRAHDLIRVTANDGKAFYSVEDTNPNPASPSASIKKLAAGVTSFPS